MDVGYRAMFDNNRSWFLATFTVMCLLDLTVSYMREQEMPEPAYVAFVGHYAVITATGIGVKRRTYDLASAWYIAITMALWSFGARHTLF